MTLGARPGHPYLAGAPLLMAHRGGSRLAPENTMVAFRQAIEDWGADVLEMDVRLTADGRVVVIHDETVDRTTNGTGVVGMMNWKDVAALDAGYRFRSLRGQHAWRDQGVTIPLFDEVLDAFPLARLNVESKVPEAAGPLMELVRSRGAEHRVLIAAEHEPTRAGARGYSGPWGASRRQVIPFWISSRLGGLGLRWAPPVDAFQVPETAGFLRVVSPTFIRMAHRANVPVHVWTVDDPSDMHRLLDWGVDGIQTDRPDLLARVLVERVGRPLPPAVLKSGWGPLEGSEA